MTPVLLLEGWSLDKSGPSTLGKPEITLSDFIRFRVSVSAVSPNPSFQDDCEGTRWRGDEFNSPLTREYYIKARVDGRVQFLLVFTETLWTRSLADPEAKEVTYLVAAGVNGKLTFTWPAL